MHFMSRMLNLVWFSKSTLSEISCIPHKFEKFDRLREAHTQRVDFHNS